MTFVKKEKSVLLQPGHETRSLQPVAQLLYVNFNPTDELLRPKFDWNKAVDTLQATRPLGYTFSSMAQQALVGQGLLIIEVSKSHAARHTTLGRTPLDE
jgi:hypothetical protein